MIAVAKKVVANKMTGKENPGVLAICFLLMFHHLQRFEVKIL